MSQTDPTQNGQTDELKKLEFEDLYDWFMLQVEPELTTLVMPHLDALYAEETPEENTERTGRYAIAFKKVEEKLMNFYSTFGAELTRLRKMCHATSEKDAVSQEAPQLESITSDLEAA
jgi:hypothetical protein